MHTRILQAKVLAAITMVQHAGIGHGSELRRGRAGNTIGPAAVLVVKTAADSRQLPIHVGDMGQGMDGGVELDQQAAVQ